MPKPELTKPAEFPKKLHKKKKDKDGNIQKSFAKIVGKHITVKKDKVNITGTNGQKPTTWVGTITKDNGGGNYESDDLEVDHEEERTGGPGRPTEDVSVTVTNDDTGTSDPVTTKMVPTID
jgi:hypothetical protein